MKTVSIRSHFLKIVIPIVAIIWIAMTGLFAWNDYQVNLASRLLSEVLIAETFITGIRQPLIQGSFIEAKIRSEAIAKSNQVQCVTINIGSEVIESCKKSVPNRKFNNTITKQIYLDEQDKTHFGNVSIVFDNSDLVMQFLGRGLRSAFGFALLAGLLFLTLSLGMKPIKSEIDMILVQAKSDPNEFQTDNFKIAEFSRVSNALRENMKAASQVAQVTASLAVAKQVAHDVRSPLASLRLLIDNLKDKIPDDYLSALKVSSKRISEIANDLIERQELKFKKYLEVVCVQEICREIIAEKHSVHTATGRITLKFENTSTNSRVLVFPSDFKRVVSNLLDNSIEASPKGEEVTVRLSNTDKNLEILITDNGKGIAEENIIHLFKPGATFGKENGKGLGLAHAKTTIEAVGGKIGISSKVGSGTEIKIVLENVIEKLDSNDLKNTQISLLTASTI